MISRSAYCSYRNSNFGFGIFVRTNIVVSINGCMFLPAVFWHQFAQYMVTPRVRQDGSNVRGTLALTITTTNGIRLYS